MESSRGDHPLSAGGTSCSRHVRRYHELWTQAFRCLAHIGLGEYAEAITAINDGLTKARDRDNTFIVGRLTNTLGWLHQELGDFQHAAEYDRDSADLGQRIGNSNVEISALINLGFDYLHLGEPEKALSLLETTLSRAEQGFGRTGGAGSCTCAPVSRIPSGSGTPRPGADPGGERLHRGQSHRLHEVHCQVSRAR